jgi:MYXO-CTERM domain-containing protein
VATQPGAENSAWLLLALGVALLVRNRRKSN